MTLACKLRKSEKGTEREGERERPAIETYFPGRKVISSNDFFNSKRDIIPLKGNLI